MFSMNIISWLIGVLIIYLSIIGFTVLSLISFYKNCKKKKIEKKILKIKKKCLLHPRCESSKYLLNYINANDFFSKDFNTSDAKYFFSGGSRINYSHYVLYNFVINYEYEDIIKRMNKIADVCERSMLFNSLRTIDPKYVFYLVNDKLIECKTRWHSQVTDNTFLHDK